MQTIYIRMTDMKRMDVLALWVSGHYTAYEASELLGVSERQAYRLKARYTQSGSTGILHRNRGRVSKRKVPGSVVAQILRLKKGVYQAFNDRHFRTMLAEREGIDLSRETIRTILRSDGIPPKQPRKKPKHRTRRERRAHEGELIQIDASYHDWFGTGRKATLSGGIDDATGKIVGLYFSTRETTNSYLQLMLAIDRIHGVPVALYSDRHTIFTAATKEGVRTSTQFSRAAQRLGMTIIRAYSPQAKGRIERLWGTLQDRLSAELKIAGITTIDEANEYLSQYIRKHNNAFAIQPTHAQPVWRCVERVHVKKQLCKTFTCTVKNDNTITLSGTIIQIPKVPWRYSFAKAKIDVRVYPDNTISLVYRWKTIRALLRNNSPLISSPKRGDMHNIFVGKEAAVH